MVVYNWLMNTLYINVLYIMMLTEHPVWKYHCNNELKTRCGKSSYAIIIQTNNKLKVRLQTRHWIESYVWGSWGTTRPIFNLSTLCQSTTQCLFHWFCLYDYNEIQTDIEILWIRECNLLFDLFYCILTVCHYNKTQNEQNESHVLM